MEEERVGVALVLDTREVDPALLAGRLRTALLSVPRMRERLVTPSPLLGRPYWVEMRRDLAAHVQTVPCPAPGDEEAFLALAAATVIRPLPPDEPLWRALVVTGLAGGRTGVVVAVRPPTVEEVMATAARGVRMPRKSTSFAPKPAMGVVMRDLHDA